jgi:glycosyltransferase involved in cell wall biosynthesis
MFSNLYPPVATGSSTQTAQLARELARRGCRVVVITANVTGREKEHEEADGVHVYRLPALRLPRMALSLNFPWLSTTFSRANVRRVRSIVERHKPDVFHLHNHMFDLAFAAVLMRRQTRTPLVVTIHTVIKHARALYNAVLYPLDRGLLKHAVINRADAIISPDSTNADYVREAFGKTDIAIVPYGISLPEAPVNGMVDSLRAKFSLAGKRVILSLGHVHAIRNRKELIEALPLVHKEHPNTVLLIVGAVADEAPAEMARRLGLNDSVIFTGSVPHAEVPAFLALADMEAHWLNQDVPEKTALGIASLEAMWAGKVILTAANEDSFIPGVLRAGEHLVRVRPDDTPQLARTIVELLDDEERRSAIGARASRAVKEHFSWDGVCAKTLEVYGEAIRKNAR